MPNLNKAIKFYVYKISEYLIGAGFRSVFPLNSDLPVSTKTYHCDTPIEASCMYLVFFYTILNLNL
jgi:hypothetical protein